ncbi:MAG: phosphatidylinositol kinase [Acidobacteria bacterium]|nr:phosphatidylinositol kinase [Acidobacteriota bacterium]
MAIQAVQHIRRMRGGAQGQLMLGSDGHPYVVKFQNNPQHMRVLANEYLASKLALAAGLTVPDVDIVEVGEWLVENTPDLEMDLGRSHERCAPGLHFGSRFMGGLMPGQVVDFLPEEFLLSIKNLGEFAGILALDKWTGNANGRQAVYVRTSRERKYRAVFIDFGYCFHAGDWKFEDAPLRGVFYRNDVYREITGWDAFEPWLTRIETMPAETVWEAARDIPPQWYGGNQDDLEALVDKLLKRRSCIRERIEEFGKSDRKPFPKWDSRAGTAARVLWQPEQKGSTIGNRVM